MPEPQPPTTPTGVRIAGDRYQWLHAWRACLQVLRDQTSGLNQQTNPAVAVGIEANHAGNVDDVVLYRQTPPHTYSQVKWTANGKTPVGTDYLTRTAPDTRTSLLAKFVAARRQLTADGTPVDMTLRTNRDIDPDSALMTGIDRRTQLLLPNAARQGPQSARGKERSAWATAASVTETELLNLLEVLRFETGYNLQHLVENVTLLMIATGLRDDTAALLTATGWIEQQVMNGTKHIGLESIKTAVTELDLKAGRAWPTISVATLKPDPVADQALHTLDWVDRFDGTNPYTKRRPAPPATWTQLAADIDNLPHHLVGVDAVLVTGSLRLAPGFALGAALRQVTGIDVAWQQGSQTWRSDYPYDKPTPPTVTATDLNQGDHTAIVVDVATIATPDVIDWIRDTSAPVRQVLSLTPPAGPSKDNSIGSPEAAISLAVGIRDIARRASRNSPTLHLFQAAPAGLAILTGHRWNRVTTTLVYEDLKSDGYELAFTIPA